MTNIENTQARTRICLAFVNVPMYACMHAHHHTHAHKARQDAILDACLCGHVRLMTEESGTENKWVAERTTFPLQKTAPWVGAVATSHGDVRLGMASTVQSDALPTPVHGWLCPCSGREIVCQAMSADCQAVVMQVLTVPGHASLDPGHRGEQLKLLVLFCFVCLL